MNWPWWVDETQAYHFHRQIQPQNLFVIKIEYIEVKKQLVAQLISRIVENGTHHVITYHWTCLHETIVFQPTSQTPPNGRPSYWSFQSL